MEGLVWLLMEMASLLAITGASFLVLGWWLRGRQTPALQSETDSPSQPSEPVSRPELVERIESLRSALRVVESERDSAAQELATARSRLESAEEEIRLHNAAAAAAAPAALPDAAPAKPKPPRKPRAKKAKG